MFVLKLSGIQNNILKKKSLIFKNQKKKCF